MKSKPVHPTVLLSFLLSAAILSAQTSNTPHTANPYSDVSFAVPLNVLPFTPPTTRQATLPPAQVIHSRDFTTRSGDSVTLEKVAPPVTSPQPQPPALDPATTALNKANFMAGLTENPRVILSLSATVYDHHYTHLRWEHNKHEYSAWSNVDFTLLTCLPSLHAGNKIYQIIMCAGVQTIKTTDVPNGLPG